MARRSAAQQPRLYWRGRGMGGSSAINGQIAIRGMLEDFDDWAAQGCAGWSGADVLPAFIRLEDDLDFGDAPYHGRGGPIPVYRAAARALGRGRHARCATAALDLGYGWHDDHNAPGSHRRLALRDQQPRRHPRLDQRRLPRTGARPAEPDHPRRRRRRARLHRRTARSGVRARTPNGGGGVPGRRGDRRSAPARSTRRRS